MNLRITNKFYDMGPALYPEVYPPFLTVRFALRFAKSPCASLSANQMVLEENIVHYYANESSGIFLKF